MDGLHAALTRAVARRGESRPDWPGAASAAAALAALDDAQLHTDVEGVAERFGVAPVEATLLGIAAAAEQTAAAHLLMGLLSGDDGPARPTVALALELAGLDATATQGRRHLSALSRLVRFGLVRVVGTDVLLSRRVVLPDRVAAHLAGHDLPPASLLPLLLDEVPVDVDGTDAVAAALRGGHQLVWIHSAAGGAGLRPGRRGVPAPGRRVPRRRPGARTGRDGDGGRRRRAAARGRVGRGRPRPGRGGTRRGRRAGRAPVPVLAVSAQPFNPDGRPSCR